jgi:hypothetical protein
MLILREYDADGDRVDACENATFSHDAVSARAQPQQNMVHLLQQYRLPVLPLLLLLQLLQLLLRPVERDEISWLDPMP